MLRQVLTCFIVGLSVSGLAVAAPTAPSRKPAVEYVSQVISAEDAAAVRRALRAADDGNWRQVRQLRNLVRDPVAKDVLTWRMAINDTPDIGFDLRREAVAELSGWPRYNRMVRYAEAEVRNSAMSAQERIVWLQAVGPTTGQGKVALADALRATGRAEDASEIIVDVWRNHALPRDVARDVLRRYSSSIEQADHRVRANLLLWIKQRTAVRDLRPQLTADYRALLDARLALQERQRGVDGRVNAVPNHLQDHPGLLFDRAVWRRKAGLRSSVSPLLVPIDGAAVPEPARDTLWDERSIAARRALKDGEYRVAYNLARPHGMSRGVDFAEAEWMAGWIALRHLGRAEDALAHFETLRDGVSTPISLARAHYWRGRALDELARPDEAMEAYREAASHKVTYYGQLAAERIGETEIYYTPSPVPTEAARVAFQTRDLVRAAKMLAEAGETGLFRSFAYHLDDQLTTSEEHQLWTEVAAQYHLPDVGVRGAKAGLAMGVVTPEAAYPVISYPLQTAPRVENAFVLALSRQESELNPRAISYANARGLMQMLPSTARTQARREGLPFRTSWLTDDPAYNMSLGAAHLDDLLDRFNGSYIMAAAAYNAGARRPAQWVQDYGDPRLGEIDPVDWVEFIPFSQTRDYVQRILENIQVYRHRLSGDAVQIRLTEDLNRGAIR